MSSTHGASFNPADSVNDQLTTYFSLVQSWQQPSSARDSLSITAGINSGSNIPGPLLFWKQHSSLDLIAPIAQDLLCAPASQALWSMFFCVWLHVIRALRQHKTVGTPASNSDCDALIL
jgi:hypothetical protein